MIPKVQPGSHDRFLLHSGSSLHRPDSPSSSNEAPGHRLRPIEGGDAAAGGVSGGGRSAWSAFWKSRIIGAPYFSNETETRVLVSRGQTCYLHCLVGNLGDRQVRLLHKNIQKRLCSRL